MVIYAVLQARNVSIQHIYDILEKVFLDVFSNNALRNVVSLNRLYDLGSGIAIFCRKNKSQIPQN